MLMVHGLVKDECESLMGMMMTTYNFGRKNIDKKDKKIMKKCPRQGTEITSKLKKVSDEEKTHKNPALRGDGLVKIII